MILVILPPVMGKIVGKIGFFNNSMATCLKEEKNFKFKPDLDRDGLFLPKTCYRIKLGYGIRVEFQVFRSNTNNFQTGLLNP